MKCDFTGCKHEAKWQAVKLFGDRKTLHVCDQHKPDASKRPASLKNVPMFYDVQPLPRLPNASDSVLQTLWCDGGEWKVTTTDRNGKEREYRAEVDESTLDVNLVYLCQSKRGKDGYRVVTAIGDVYGTQE